MPTNPEYFHEVIKQRRSVRSYKPDAIPPEVLDRILAAACWAPSAMNRQPWKFFVLTDEMRDRLAAIHQPIFEAQEQTIRERLGEEALEIRRKLYSNLGGAPVAIACFTEIQEGNSKKDIISAALACENLVLTAWAEGIASLIMTSSLVMAEEISFLCGVDTKKAELVMVILLGYAEQVPDAPERRKKRVAYASTPADIRQQ
jgi:nitroreductase